MTETENRQIVEKVYAALKDHDVERYLELHDVSYVLETDASPTPLRGMRQRSNTWQRFSKVFLICDSRSMN